MVVSILLAHTPLGYVTMAFGGKWHNLVKVKSFCR
jgi:hypothetical protein